MKRIVLVLSFVFICSIINAQNWDYFIDKSKTFNYEEKKYRIINYANIYNNKGNIIDHVYPDIFFSSSKTAYVQDETNQPFDLFEYFIGYDDGWISTDDIVLNNSEVLPDLIVTYNKNRFEKSWVPVWYNELLTLNKKIENFSNVYESFGFKYQEEFTLTHIHKIIINNNFLIFNPLISLDYFFSIKKIEQKNSVFIIYSEIGENAQNGYYNFNDILKEDSFENLPDLSKKRNCTFIIEQNGNRIRLYNGESYQLITELMKTDKAWNDSMVEYIKSDYKNKMSNLIPIVEKLEHQWSNPKTGLYEETTVVKTKVTSNQTMTVSENLKLRSGEATSTQVLTVMSAGTKVKILELGKVETIDGISSNWVKVEVQSDAKDRDGKPIKAGTVGWCYGGYLK